MTTRRYKAHFKASFEVTIEAPDDEAMKELVREMEKLPWGSWAAAADAHQIHCEWNHSKLLDAND